MESASNVNNYQADDECEGYDMCFLASDDCELEADKIAVNGNSVSNAVGDASVAQASHVHQAQAAGPNDASAAILTSATDDSRAFQAPTLATTDA